MSLTVKCEKCGAENRLGQLFCRECGAKLDLSNLKHEGDKRHHGNKSGGFSLLRLLRLVILAALLVALGLLCWPTAPAGDASSAEGARIVSAKMTALRGAIMRNNDVTDRVAEADINAHLNALLISAAKPQGFALHLREVRLDFKPERTGVWMKSRLGPLPITYASSVEVERQPDGQWQFSAGAVHVGHMPLPGPLRNRTLGQITGTFLRLQEEWMLLNRLARVEILDGALEVSTTAGKP